MKLTNSLNGINLIDSLKKIQFSFEKPNNISVLYESKGEINKDKNVELIPNPLRMRQLPLPCERRPTAPPYPSQYWGEKK